MGEMADDAYERALEEMCEPHDPFFGTGPERHGYLPARRLIIKPKLDPAEARDLLSDLEDE